MLCIGLTGGIGCGKSTVAELFRKLGAQIIDTDVIAHQLTQAHGIALPALHAEFDAAYFHADGTLNRAAMRELIFSQAAAKLTLETILHPLILQQVQLQLARPSTARYTLLIVPLLLQSPAFLAQVQRILLVDCSEALQIQRVMQRSQLSAAQIHNIIAQQTPRATQFAAADDLISNELDLNHLALQVRRLHDIYLQQSSIND
ncbi:MAG: dephospho-CoA kinase [Sideroxydans sp.]|nr:dephospho-CoA kinase [Sideroxydans sp.]